MLKVTRLCFLIFPLGVAVTGSAQDDRMFQTIPPKAKLYKESNVPVMIVNELVTAAPIMTRTMTVSDTRGKKGAKSIKHNHPEEEVLYLISGRLRVVTPELDVILEPGDRLLLESYVEHQWEALEDSFIVEVFGPGRLLAGHE